MRAVSEFFILLGCAGLLILGGGVTMIGLSDQTHADHAYVVRFAQPGDACGDEALELSKYSGEVLECRPGGGSATLPGFTEAQNTEVITLAKKLGAKLGGNGLTVADQARIQERVTEIAATLPGTVRHNPYQTAGLWGMWGARQAWLGGGMVATGVVCFLALLWRAARSRRRWR